MKKAPGMVGCHGNSMQRSDCMLYDEPCGRDCNEFKCDHGLHPGFCMDCAYSVDTHKTQLDRCIRGIRTALSILTDLLDEEKRKGPTADNPNARVRDVRRSQTVGGCSANDAEEEAQ